MVAPGVSLSERLLIEAHPNLGLALPAKELPIRRNLGGSQDNDYGSWAKKRPVLRIIGSISSHSVEDGNIA